MADIFDEVSEEIRAERRTVALRRYGLLGAGLLVLVAVALGAWQFTLWQGRQRAQAVAGTFLAAMQAADAATPGARDADRSKAIAGFATVAADGPEGYRVLARLREAGLRAQAGDLKAALALWDQVSSDGSAPSLLRSFSVLLWVQHQVDDGDPASLLARLQPLLSPSDAWRPLAEELQALLLLRSGEDEPGRAVLRRLAGDVGAANGVRQRASLVLQSLGEKPPPGAPQQAAPSLDGGLGGAGE